MSVPDVVKTIFEEFQKIRPDVVLFDLKQLTPAAYTKWDYCVQYRETDFNFVSRLLEQEGIFYFFQHEQGKHTSFWAIPSKLRQVPRSG